jgi:hypothetical protein
LTLALVQDFRDQADRFTQPLIEGARQERADTRGHETPEVTGIQRSQLGQPDRPLRSRRR